MKVIVVISPDFLEASYKESEKYSFCIQGYGNFTMASKRLAYTNVSDILGFAFICKRMPAERSKGFNDMLGFLKLCDSMERNKKFVIITQDSLNYGSKFKQYKNLQITYQQNVEYITDTTINRDVFGSILLANYEPYIFKKPAERSYTGYTCNTLSFRPLVPDTLFEVLEKVHPLDTLDATIENDIVINKFNHNDVLIGLRTIVIKLRLGLSVTEDCAQFLESIQDLDPKSYGIHYAFLDYVLKGEDTDD